MYWNLCSSVWSNSHALFLIKEGGWECPIRDPWVSLSLKQLFGWAQSHFGKPKCSASSEFKAPSQLLETSFSLHLLKMILTCGSASEAGVSCLSIIFPSCFALSTLGWDVFDLTQSLGGGWWSLFLLSPGWGSVHAECSQGVFPFWWLLLPLCCPWGCWLSET